MADRTAEDQALLEDVKRYLNAEWEEDGKIVNLINAAKAYLDSKRGAPADYSQPGFPRTLLFDHVRYHRDNALDVFENNYRHLILAMQTERRADDADDEEEPES